MQPITIRLPLRWLIHGAIFVLAFVGAYGFVAVTPAPFGWLLAICWGLLLYLAAPVMFPLPRSPLGRAEARGVTKEEMAVKYAQFTPRLPRGYIIGSVLEMGEEEIEDGVCVGQRVECVFMTLVNEDTGQHAKGLGASLEEAFAMAKTNAEKQLNGVTE